MNLQFFVQNDMYKAVRGFENLSEIQRMFSHRHIGLTAVRNQSAAFQAVFFSDEVFTLSITGTTCFDKTGMLPNIRLSPEPSTGGDINISIFIEGFVEDDDMLQKADILLKDENVHVGRRQLQPVWIELSVPKTAVPGIYDGCLGVYSSFGFGPETRIGELTFRIDVKEVTLPDPADYKFFLDLWQHNSNIARKNEVRLWSDEHFDILEKYVESLARLGQKAITIVASEIPWSGQFCFRSTSYPSNLYEYNMIKVVRDEEGVLRLDFSVVDRYIDLCFKYGIREEIEIFGLLNIWTAPEEGFGKVIEELSDAIRVRYFDQRDGCYDYIDNVSELKAYIGSVERHFSDQGLVDKVRIVADEPEDAQVYNERLGFLTEAAPLFRYKVALCHPEFIDTQAHEKVVDFVPILYGVGDKIERYRELREKTGGRICWYVCCAPLIPNTFIRSNLLESWLIGWLTDYLEFDGFLRWNYTVWPEEPRRQIRYRAELFRAGDMNFVYPSASGEPLLTLRYKALLKGIQTFELLQMLKEKGRKAEEAICAARGKLFRFASVTEFQKEETRLDRLVSTECSDYEQAQKILLHFLELVEEG